MLIFAIFLCVLVALFGPTVWEVSISNWILKDGERRKQYTWLCRYYKGEENNADPAKDDTLADSAADP